MEGKLCDEWARYRLMKGASEQASGGWNKVLQSMKKMEEKETWEERF
jgi:hypothetical protein